jgi:hypothetical protein
MLPSAQKRLAERFDQLEKSLATVRPGKSHPESIDRSDWERWSTSALNLIKAAFGEASPHYSNLQQVYSAFAGWRQSLESATGVFLAAKDDFENGFSRPIDLVVSGEVLGDFIGLARAALTEGHREVAAVLASAALEDSLKRLAIAEGLHVEDKVMQGVIAALKARGLVGGAQKSLLETLPRFRDFAMHANWTKINAEDVSGVIGFVERFLLERF